MHTTLPSPLRRFLRDKYGNIVLWQRPNVPLAIWIVVTALGVLLRPGGLRSATHLVAHIALYIWAVLELFWGVSPFRRLLGLIVILLTTWMLLR